MKGSEPSSTATTPSTSSAARAWRSAERIRLGGPSVALDRRVHAVRADIADIDLAPLVFASHYARATLCRCTVPAATIYAEADATTRAVSQLLLGEEYAVLDVTGGWAWGYRRDDHYVGYVAANALGPGARPSHIVTAPLALVFAAPDIKSPVVARWPVGARFRADAADSFLACAEGFVHARHARAIDDEEGDAVAVAERLIGLPYLWGGRGGGGIDCSGLVQVALGRCGIDAPRDTDQQRAALGETLPEGAPLRRGDLVFLPGHVGLMTDGARLIHANAHWMAVTVEPLADVLARQPEGTPVTLKRIAA